MSAMTVAVAVGAAVLLLVRTIRSGKWQDGDRADRVFLLIAVGGTVPVIALGAVYVRVLIALLVGRLYDQRIVGRPDSTFACRPWDCHYDLAFLLFALTVVGVLILPPYVLGLRITLGESGWWRLGGIPLLVAVLVLVLFTVPTLRYARRTPLLPTSWTPGDTLASLPRADPLV